MAGRTNIVKVAIIGDSRSLEVAAARGESKLSKLGAGAAKAGKVIGIGLAVGVVGVAVAAYKIGESFDEAYDHIRIGTGKTGKQLELLKGDFKQVVKDVPTDFQSASTAIADINKRLGLTGKPLRERTEQFLELSRITKTDLGENIKGVTGLFNNFGIKAADQGGKLDLLFRASQATGMSVGDLASEMSKGGVTLRAAGLGFADSAALLGTLNKAGLSASDILPGLGKSMAKAAKDGKDASTVFYDAFNAIKTAPSATKAAGIALDVFGAKGGPKLAAAIREGKLSWGDLEKTIRNGKDTIIGAGSDTQDFAEKWTKFKNRVLVGVAPLAAKVFDGLGKAMDKLPAIVEKLRAKGEQLSAWAQKHQPIVKALAITVGTLLVFAFGAWAVSAAAAALATLAAIAPVLAVGAAIGALAFGISYAWQRFEIFREVVRTTVTTVQQLVSGFVAAFQSLWARFGGTITRVAGAAFDGFKQMAQGAFNVIVGIVKIFAALFTGNWTAFWNGIKQATGGAFGYISGLFKSGVNLLLLPFRVLQDSIRGNVDNIFGFFAALPGRLGGVLKGVGGVLLAPVKVGLNGLVHLWNNTIGKIAHGQHYGVGPLSVTLPDLRIPEFHKGGRVNFGSAGEGLAWLRNDEVVLTPEQTSGAGRGGWTGDVIQNFPSGATPAVVNASQRRWDKRNRSPF